MSQLRPEVRHAATVSYLAAALFALSLARFGVLPRLHLPPSSPLAAELNGGLLPVVTHLLVFPVVAALPAPPWAKAAGYGWLVIDITTDIMALGGVQDALYLPMRYGGHVSAALWIAAASWEAGGALRVVGLLLALDLGGYSLLMPFLPLAALYPSALLLVIWFALVGLHLARGRAVPA